MRLFRVSIRAQSEFLFRCYSDPLAPERSFGEILGTTLTTSGAIVLLFVADAYSVEPFENLCIY
jgi:hypothetical protein